jgi:succinoglycan biosynthesis transport protein ExoP
MKFAKGDFLPDLSVLRSLRAALVRRRRWVIGSTLAIAAATAAAYTMAPPAYLAQGSVWLDGSNAATGTPAAGAGGVQARDAELRVLTSEPIVAQVVDTLGLARIAGIGQPEGATTGLAEGRARAIRHLTDGLETKTKGTARTAIVRFAAHDPALAAAIVNATLERYVALRGGGGLDERGRSLLRRQIDQTRDDIIRAEAAVAAFRSATAALPAASASDRRARRDVANADRAGDAVAEETQLRSERVMLVQRLGSKHPDIKAIDNRLAELARDRRRAAAATVRLAQSLRAADQRLAEARVARSQVSGELSRFEQSRSRLGDLRTELKALRARHADLIARQHQADSAQGGARNGATIIARAAVPTVAAFPRLWAYVLGGIAAALAAAVAIALGGDVLTRGFRNRGHAERKLGVPVIGVVPDLHQLLADGGARAARVDPADYLFADTRSPFTAAFRAIHTALRLGTAAQSPRSVAISSALPEEGKTTVSICLARSAALAGLRVLLIDCDVRHPAATRALAAHVSTGLVQVLRGDAPLKDALLRDTPSGAWVLGHSSAGGENADDLIASPAMAALLDTLAPDFDLVVLDTPPALALDEARGVAAMADCVLLVARWRKTPVASARIALEQLRRAGAEVTGAVLTLVGR